MFLLLLNLNSNSDATVELELGISISNSISELNKSPENRVIKSTGIFLVDEIFSNNTLGLADTLFIASIFISAVSGSPFHEIVPPFLTLNGLLIMPPYLKSYTPLSTTKSPYILNLSLVSNSITKFPVPVPFKLLPEILSITISKRASFVTSKLKFIDNPFNFSEIKALLNISFSTRSSKFTNLINCDVSAVFT